MPKTSKREEEHRQNGSVDHTQHVSNDHWYGHDAPDDKRFHVDHAFQHGHFEHFGPSYRYSVARIDRDHHRFWFPGGFYFQIADWDWPLAADWCWDCGDDFIVYEDPDHIGWYLLYNIHTGVYVHLTYLGLLLDAASGARAEPATPAEMPSWLLPNAAPQFAFTPPSPLS